MNILDEIVGYKKIEVAQRRAEVPEAQLEQESFFLRPALSLKRFLLDRSRTGIIAEFKRQSPSKGVINGNADVVDVTMAYANNGASGLSVLTDGPSFGGSAEDLVKARINEVPILRKEFIIDLYQISEAKAMGADVILLIAAILTPRQVKEFTLKAHELGLEVILEIHDETELLHINDFIDVVGVNNRNLKTFEVSLEQSVSLSRLIPGGKIKISESGIHSVHDIQYLKGFGYHGFLIGENFMKQPDPALAFMKFVSDLNETNT
jgi:indole-3-glycerol phosphate synthase